MKEGSQKQQEGLWMQTEEADTTTTKKDGRQAKHHHKKGGWIFIYKIGVFVLPKNINCCNKN